MRLSNLLKAFKLITIENGVARCRYVPTFFGGDPPSNTTSTVNQSNLPKWAEPQAKQMVAAATKQLFQTNDKGEITGINPYVPYSTNPRDYVAGFSPMQQQAFAQAANLQVPGQYAQATDMVNAAGMGGMQSAQQALAYGDAGFQSGQLGQRLGIEAANRAAAQAAEDRAAAQRFGEAGFQSGQMGQQFGMQSAQKAQDMANFYGAQGANYGAQAANLAGQAQNYGAAGASYGDLASQLGLQGMKAQDYGMDVGQQARNYAAQAAATGQNYGTAVTSPYVVQQYMNPYQRGVTDLQKAAALREFQVGQQGRQANAARSGAYGGARQAIENAEAQRNLNTALQNIEAQGLQNAYTQALANIGTQQQYGLQGLNAAQTGLGTALQGGQLGISGLAQAISGQNAAMQGQQVGLGGVNAANQAYQTGIQGANAGLAGVGQFINAGNLGLAGTAQGMQGAQVGLQGVNASTAAGRFGLEGAQVGLQGTEQGMKGAGYGLQGVQGAQQGYQLANQAGTNLSNIGAQQLAAQRDIINMQNQFGAQQQANQQAIIDAGISNYANAQNNPMQQLHNYNALLRGLGSTETKYAPAPSMGSQLAGAGMSAAAMYGMMKAEGGVIDEPKTYKSGGLVDLAIANAMGEV